MSRKYRAWASWVLRFGLVAFFLGGFIFLATFTPDPKTPIEAVAPLPVLVPDIPYFDGPILTMDLSEDGNILYLGGYFTSISTNDGANYYERSHLAALDAHTFEVLDWNPSADDPVGALVVSGEDLFVGGSFSSIGGEPRNEFAKIDGISGEVIYGCNPDVFTELSGSTVYSIDVAGDYIYIGGDFDKIGGGDGVERNGLARLDLETCELDTEWNPNVDNFQSHVVISDIAVDGHYVYIVGNFSSIGDVEQTQFARIDVVTGEVDPLCDISVNYEDYYGFGGLSGYVFTLEIDNDYVYIGGRFESLFDLSEQEHYLRNNIARLHKNETCSIDVWNPGADYDVFTINVEGKNVYVGGNFYEIGDEDEFEGQFAKLSRSFGSVDTSWNPMIYSDSIGVRDSIFSDNALFVVGDFMEALGRSVGPLAIFALDSTPPSITLTPLIPDPTSDNTP